MVSCRYTIHPPVLRLAAWLLSLALLLHNFSRTVVIVDFYANRDSIARELCINRFRATAISCGGTCQLDKRLRQDNKDSNDSERRPDNRTIVVLSSHSYYLTSFLFHRHTAARHYPPAIVADPIDRPSSHFHPPGWPSLSFL